MEMILLAFCLTSVAITSVIVALELRREEKQAKPFFGDKTKAPVARKQNIRKIETKAGEQLRMRVFETLDRQLNRLGYQSGEPQLQFVNRALNSRHTDLTELTPNELRNTFTAILQARETRVMTAGN